ncbi:polysaccharide pyruvyl transferase family protein [Pseudarthrobacter sp. B4EP4b]|uniref:polysaccharide pyruvyl transferase family protein n=1 Tax=Pseudarthrobacter sp. B4EP4b TaxID=2590664 RepID=UPI001154EFAF|nr:polysaccharide pyruvyl transferase family protein [Pseudarthrobacter sp. B4EP4b]
MSESLYLVASGGHPNYGDELIIASWLRLLSQVRPHATVWLDSPQPGNASSLFSDIHSGFRSTDTLWRSCREAPDQSADGVWDYVENLVSDGGSPMYDAGLETLGTASSLHLLGGGYINGVWPDHVGLVAGLLAARKLNGGRLFGTGLGLLPLPGIRVRLKNAFDSFYSVSVRDQGSAEELGIGLGLDDAFLGLPYELKRSRSGVAQSKAKDVMLCIQSDMTEEDTFEKLERKLRLVIKRAIVKGLTVGYVEAIPESDRRMFDALSDLIPDANFVPFLSVWNHGLPVRHGQQWYTTRFHPHLVAAAAGATGVAVGIKDGYYDIKHQSLLDLGTGWTYSRASLDDDLPEPTGNDFFASSSLEFTARKRAEALSLYPLC